MFDPLFADESVSARIDDRAVVRAMLDVEAALAQAEASVGVIPAGAAAAITEACAAEFDVAAVGRAAESSGNPVVPLVRAIEKLLPDDARPWVHHGATSQDVLDTALMLCAARARVRLVEALHSATGTLATAAREHRRTLMVGRTLGQQALPTTFGLKAAGWLTALDAAAGRLRAAELAVQFGGAAGTLAALGSAGLSVGAALARELGLAEPALPWHTDRQRILELGSALAAVSAALGKIALDVTLLAQSEVGEVAEGGGGGGSSAMPHKRNPANAILTRSASIRTPGLLATLFSAAAQQEHERATGGWHAEWEPLRELFAVAGGAAGRAARFLPVLQVDAPAMRRTLDATGGVLLSEHVSGVLAGSLGRSAAHDLVKNAVASGQPLRDVLLRAGVDADRVDAALDPAGYLGSADALIDRALAAHADAWKGSFP
ncbi:3-carboxy-cis,cis-muconate cycloisomerase [Cryptosporangium phraense]|uniref:3-carboxy-cis,cis-muconate cycloisomerase n=1 Tax=Cryptosporangium phraense TaxID=2593070 RepID=A0A545AZF6_9ACTN|nr:3-carboxy-cis,cis-muconate cycloisomerase [Cryptosporangium phraense]